MAHVATSNLQANGALVGAVLYAHYGFGGNGLPVRWGQPGGIGLGADLAQLQADCEARNGMIWDQFNRRCVQDPSTMTQAQQTYSRGCPEAAVPDGRGGCKCRDGWVWNSTRTKCVSPQYVQYEVRYTGDGGDRTQEQLRDSVRNYLAQYGVSIRCKISEDFVHTPAGGKPSLLCSINGGPYVHGAYAINNNPNQILNQYVPNWQQIAAATQGGSRTTTEQAGDNGPNPTTTPSTTGGNGGSAIPTNAWQPSFDVDPAGSGGGQQPSAGVPNFYGSGSPGSGAGAGGSISDFFQQNFGGDTFTAPVEAAGGLPMWVLLLGGGAAVYMMAKG